LRRVESREASWSAVALPRFLTRADSGAVQNASACISRTASPARRRTVITVDQPAMAHWDQYV
jgi:hypothetical protein